MKIVDANFILRYLLNDIPEQAEEAYQLLNENEVHLINEVIAEIVYVLEKIYKAERKKIGHELNELIHFENIRVNDVDVLTNALATYAETKLDFVDCVLSAYAKVHRTTIFTFDKKLLRVIENQ